MAQETSKNGLESDIPRWIDQSVCLANPLSALPAATRHMNSPTSPFRPPSRDRRTISRRTFFKTGAAAAVLSAASWQRVLGANERVGIGIIGYGLIGRIHTRNFKAQSDANMVA